MKQKMKLGKPKLKYISLDKIHTPPFIKEYMSIPNKTDDYLPIERLENKGRKVLRNDNYENNIYVWVGKSENILEGCYTELGGISRLLDKDDLCKTKQNLEDVYEGDSRELVVMSIQINGITDYNSLWEITKSGWNNNNDLYPYICIDDGEGYSLWRWDNPNLRLDMGILKWTDECKERYKKEIFPQERLYHGNLIRQGKVEIPKKVGRNTPCICGSGVKFKKCCLTNNQVGIS
jgi:hypothetical protein